jgi:hypothetical protein
LTGIKEIRGLAANFGADKIFLVGDSGIIVML